jgi:hypothetical protein
VHAGFVANVGVEGVVGFSARVRYDDRFVAEEAFDDRIGLAAKAQATLA